MEDDSMLVTEESVRNSGIWSGTYLKRGKYVNETTDAQRFFVPQVCDCGVEYRSVVVLCCGGGVMWWWCGGVVEWSVVWSVEWGVGSVWEFEEGEVCE
jgi:hypothetical protein